MAQIILGGGCFWCTEALFQQLRGVSLVESGYSGGETSNPNYEDVCSGRTGHAEVIQVTYDPLVVSFADLVRVHLATHNPTTLNQQGADKGTQYRSIIFYRDDVERVTALQLIDEVQQTLGKPVVTHLQLYHKFYPAESYHQNYYSRNEQYPYCVAVIEPKLSKLRASLSDLLIPQN